MTMKVVLTQDVPNVGKSGQVVKVKDGFGRNFLFPQQLAYSATSTNLKRIEQLEKKRKAKKEEEKRQAQELAEKLNKVSCTVSVEVNDLDRLYGAVSDSDVSKALEVEGFSFDRKKIVIEKPIEELGIYEVGVQLHPEVMARIRVWVTKK